MQLTMTVLRCPDAVAPETRSVAGGELSVGRGPGVDWVLPDPERLLSKRHFALAYRSGVWQLADTSTNGTFLNRETAPIGINAVRKLADGDRVRLGVYEIEVRLDAGAVARSGAASGGGRFEDPFAMDPFGPQRPLRNPFDEPDHLGARIAPTAAQLPLDYDPLAPEPVDVPFRGPTQADHSPVMQDAFRPPQRGGQTPLHSGGVIPGDDLLPDDWDNDLQGGIAPPAAQPVPQPATRSASRKPPEPAAPPVLAPAPPRQPAADHAALLAAFFEGAGQPDLQPADPAAAMLELGKAFRALVAGLRAVLMARAAIKSEFRIEQTMIRARGNNPLKFSAGDEDALAALLGAGRRTDMAPHEAVADALRDIRLHELASMAAMQAAVRALLDGLDPARLRAGAEQGGGMTLLPAQKKARAWDAYEALYARTVQALSDDFDSAFGKAFARAYERSLNDVSIRERR
jgi:type VI secretion system protein ImpI/type VI secretion system protein